ncbi:ribonuclease HI [Paraglaciecola sp. L1A13]|uniref:ribonuclease HI n=1 Tax=Paraglaciecola sp. L1A13 TaxID=2686359 RepID=UPI00131AFC84|nr:RNase H family protein [Paraglaciecola sp. L1A13]
MAHLRLFTDGSVNTQIQVGYGAYLLVSELTMSNDTLKEQVKIKRFEQTSSTKLELQTLLWALAEIDALVSDKDTSLTVYTDSQNIIDLPSRQARLEDTDFFTNSNKRLNNYQLYKAFYRFTAGRTCTFVKVIGHQTSSKKDQIDKCFTLVDKASRRAMREEF